MTTQPAQPTQPAEPTTPDDGSFVVNMPDITPAQIIAAVGSVIGLLLSNLVIDAGTAKLLTDTAAIVVPAVFLIADAIIRHGRARLFENIPGDKIVKAPPKPGSRIGR